MAFSREDYIELGTRVGAPTLIDGGRRVIGAWGDDIPALAPFGFGEDKRAELSSLLDDTEARYREFGGSEGDVVSSGMTVRELVGQGKGWVRRVQAAALNAFEDTPVADTFTSEPAVGSSVKRLIRAMTTYTGLAETHVAELAPFGADAAFVADGRRILSELQGKRETQGQTWASMPERAAELQHTKGRAYLLMKQLSRAARIALPVERARSYFPTRVLVSPARRAKKEAEAEGQPA